jgi:hypothetical protein
LRGGVSEFDLTVKTGLIYGQNPKRFGILLMVVAFYACPLEEKG